MGSIATSGSVYNTTRLEGESTLYAYASGEPKEEDGELAAPPTFTIDDAFAHLGFGRTQLLMFFFCGLAWAGDGMEMMLLSYLGPEVRCLLAGCRAALGDAPAASQQLPQAASRMRGACRSQACSSTCIVLEPLCTALKPTSLPPAQQPRHAQRSRELNRSRRRHTDRAIAPLRLCPTPQ